MDEAWVEELKTLRDEYMERLKSRIAQPGLSWPETEAYLRAAMLELAREIRDAEEAVRQQAEEDAAVDDTEAISSAFT